SPDGQGGISKDGRSRYGRGNFLEHFQPFSGDAVVEDDKTGGIAAWPRQAIDVAGADRVGASREHNRNGTGRLLQWCDCRPATGQQEGARTQSGASAANAAGSLRMSPALLPPQR